MTHQRPHDFTARSWKNAKKIIRYVGTFAGDFSYDRRRPISVREIAEQCELCTRTVERLMPKLVRDRIIGRRIHRLGRGVPALTWVCPPERQIIAAPQTKRTARVAAVLPQIRQALLEDRQSLRPVAKQFGVSLDTVLDERRRLVPYDPGTAGRKRCPGCGAMIDSERCLRCTLTTP
jgi:hypothetical protein